MSRRARWLVMVVLLSGLEVIAQDEPLLRVEGDRVLAGRDRNARLMGLLAETERILDIEIQGKELGEDDMYELPFESISKEQLWGAIQRVIAAERLAIIPVGTPSDVSGSPRYRLLSAQRVQDLPARTLMQVPMVTARDLRENASVWLDRPAWLIQTIYEVGDLSSEELAEAITRERGQMIQRVEALPDSGRVLAWLPAPQAVLWARMIDALADPGLWPAVRFRRYELQRLAPHVAERLVEEFLEKRNGEPPVPDARHRHQVVMEIPGRAAVIVRADVRVLDEVQQLLAIADR